MWVEVNERLCKLLGYTEVELSQKSWTELTHLEDHPAAESQFQQMIEEVVKGYATAKRFRRKDGKTLAAVVSAQCMRKEDGTADCILAVVLDVTDHRRVEESLPNQIPAKGTVPFSLTRKLGQSPSNGRSTLGSRRIWHGKMIALARYLTA